MRAAPAHLVLLRTTVDLVDLVRGAERAYAGAVCRLVDARALAVDAYRAGNAGDIRRAWRSVEAANVEADRLFTKYQELREQAAELAKAADAPRAHRPPVEEKSAAAPGGVRGAGVQLL